MKVKIVLIIIALWIGQFSYAQDHKNVTQCVKSLDLTIEEGTYSTEKNSDTENNLIFKSSETASYNETLGSSTDFFSLEEWKRTKKILLKNKERIVKMGTYITRKIDTVFIPIPSFSGESSISGW
ncbi:hypothetical protein ACFSTE_11845 [Aquimarina hainanensis]|uniref:Uncharacterized protein n=1 Tax=Aquimarina hainanensis TaxID=1578017 RepID=A0ABW5N7U4_9FLAO